MKENRREISVIISAKVTRIIMADGSACLTGVHRLACLAVAAAWLNNLAALSYFWQSVNGIAACIRRNLVKRGKNAIMAAIGGSASCCRRRSVWRPAAGPSYRDAMAWRG